MQLHSQWKMSQKYLWNKTFIEKWSAFLSNLSQKREFQQVYTSNTCNFKKKTYLKGRLVFSSEWVILLKPPFYLLQWTSSLLKTQKVKYQPQGDNCSMKYTLMMAYTRIYKSQHYIHFELDHLLFFVRSCPVHFVTLSSIPGL